AARSERQMAEGVIARLGESQAALAEAQRLAQIGSFEWDIASDEVTWSDELFRIFGLDPDVDPASYESWRGCIHEEDRDLADGTIAQAYTDRAPYSFVHRIIRPDGRMRTVECHGQVEADDLGSPVKM